LTIHNRELQKTFSYLFTYTELKLFFIIHFLTVTYLIKILIFMKTNATIFSLLLLFFVTSLQAQNSIEKAFIKEKATLGGDVLIKSTQNLVVNDESFTNFLVEAPSSGEYYINFWMIPAQYGEKEFSTYKVYVNNMQAGKILPVKGNWQTIGLADNKKVNLKEGENMISVAGKIPEVPNVEFVRLSKSVAKCQISSTAYDTYLAGAEKNNKIAALKGKNVANVLGDTLVSTQNHEIVTLNGVTYYVSRNKHVAYTFYTKVYLTAGSNVTFSSNSSLVHYLEVFGATNSNYTWTAPGMTTNYMTVNIPESGYYYVKARTAQYLNRGTANVYINGQAYLNVPIFTGGSEISQGGNYNYYGCFTKNSSPTDPFITIQSQYRDGDLILAYNDDWSGNSYAIKYGLATSDSYIRKVYPKMTRSILLSSYSSSSPEGTCDIYGNVLDSDIVTFYSTADNTETYSENTTDNSTILATEIKIAPNPVTLGTSVNITGIDGLQQVMVYDLSGRLLQTVNGDSLSGIVPLSDLNINKKGVYILVVVTKTETKTRKLIVN